MKVKVKVTMMMNQLKTNYMLDDAKKHFNIKRRECKDLRKELKALKQAFDELNASHKRLEEVNERLGKAHKKLEKAHSCLIDEQNKKSMLILVM